MKVTGSIQPESRVLLSWSSGKDSAWTLKVLRDQGVEPVALFTTVNGNADRVAMHAVRTTLLQLQASAVGLPLIVVELPWPCDNVTYEVCVRERLEKLIPERGITHMAFGDLFLEDVRAYRESQVAAVGLEPAFPLWGSDTTTLARKMIAAGLRARITCVDSEQLSAELSGQPYDHDFLDSLPAEADPCGENGEFHSFVWGGPMFSKPLSIQPGESVTDGQFVYSDFLPAEAQAL